MRISENTRNLCFVFLLLLVIFFMSFTIFYLVKNKTAFFENPFQYGAEKLDVSCSCICDDLSLNFDKDSFIMEKWKLGQS